MIYGRVHRFLLRSIASRGVLSLAETEQVLNKFTDNNLEETIPDLVKGINDEIRPYQQALKITNDELTNEEVIVFLSLGYDDATKAQNVFSPNELEYFRILLEQIMSTESRQVTGIHAINLVGNMKTSFTKTDAQKVLNTWCNMRYLDKEGTNYALGVRAVHEFESYFMQNMPDTIEKCCLCSKIVFRGYNCPACHEAVHTRCLNVYLERVQNWPCCKIDFSQDQLDRLSSESSRLSITQPLEATQQLKEEPATEPTQELVEDVDLSQQFVPEISQRATRTNRKRKLPGD